MRGHQQLQKVARWERDKEDACARQFQLAQQQVQNEKLKLQHLEQYKREYLNQHHLRGSAGVEAKHFSQFHSFIAKLDKACEQQLQIQNQAVLVAEQRKQQWLAQQRKRKAVEMLLQKKADAEQLLENKREQAMLDEIALQKFVRG
ncbi:flagellar export protein FliJ [Aestuariibacter halophilus]|uniref:Flagellar FliJ protein n=1 Tax=Fluctibacter halophilus TaxID=226011 RepID=A0ABS8G3J1_9ALTE|nr:flagellar export protein FliJ [Aestuariibacter halophilus]MCC2615149.1 flagellar export protein FliJ [Aestuariibacter halophilus]